MALSGTGNLETQGGGPGMEGPGYIGTGSLPVLRPAPTDLPRGLEAGMPRPKPFDPLEATGGWMHIAQLFDMTDEERAALGIDEEYFSQFGNIPQGSTVWLRPGYNSIHPPGAPAGRFYPGGGFNPYWDIKDKAPPGSEVSGGGVTIDLGDSESKTISQADLLEGYVPGGDDDEYLFDSANRDDAGNPFMWQDYISDRLHRDMQEVALALGIDEFAMNYWVDANLGPLFEYLDQAVIAPTMNLGKASSVTNPDGTVSMDPENPELLVDAEGHTFWTQSLTGLERLYLNARLWIGSQDQELQDALLNIEETTANNRKPQTYGGGGGLSRKDFDKEGIALRITDIWRSYLLESPKNANALADAYITEYLKNPRRQLDLEAFILAHFISKTGRYKSIYADKPDSLSEAEFLGPYLQSALSILGPDEAADVAMRGAMFGASPMAFQQRMRRGSDATIAPFVQGMQQRMYGLRRLFGNG